MGVVRCPECGGRTILRVSKISDIKYYVCSNYPECKGRVPVEGSVYTEIGGGRSMGRPRMEDMRRQREEPSRKGMVLADEPPTNIWNKENYASRSESRLPQHKKSLGMAAGIKRGESSEKRWPRSAEAAEYRARRQGVRSSADGGAPRAARVSVKAERGLPRGGYRPVGRRGAAEPSWGDDWDDGNPAPKAAPERPPRRVMAEGKTRAGEGKPSSPRRRTAPSKGVTARKRQAPEPLRKTAPKAATAKPRPPKEPEIVDDEFKQMAPKEEESADGGRKRSPLVVIIALAVAFLAIDGIIYAAVQLISE